MKQFEKEFLLLLAMLEDDPQTKVIQKYLRDWFSSWVNVISVRIHKDSQIEYEQHKNVISNSMHRELCSKLMEVEDFDFQWQSYGPQFDVQQQYMDLNLFYFRKNPKKEKQMTRPYINKEDADKKKKFISDHFPGLWGYIYGDD